MPTWKAAHRTVFPLPPGAHRDALRLSQSLQGTQVSLAFVPVWGPGYQGPEHGKWGEGVFFPRVTWRSASLFPFEKDTGGTPPVVQWLRLHTPNAGVVVVGGLDSIPGQRSRSLMPPLRLLTPLLKTPWASGKPGAAM